MYKKLRFSDNGHITNNSQGRVDYLFENRPKKKIYNVVRHKTENQLLYMEAIDNNDIIFCTGVAGSGKTHIAVGMAVEGLKTEQFQKIIAIRPCIGVTRTLGYLPGDINDKVTPFLRPIFDELHKFFTVDEIKRLQSHNILETGSLEHVRGRTFEDAYVILDEAQNCTREELKVFLTRLGQGSKLVINGDITRDGQGFYTQCDLPLDEQGAFEYQCNNLKDLEGVKVIQLLASDCVRHPLVQKMLERGL